MKFIHKLISGSYEERCQFLKKLLDCIGCYVKHLDIHQIEVKKINLLTAVASYDW